MKVIIVLICYVLAPGRSSGEEENEFQFLHSTMTFNVLENNTIGIPCALSDMDNTTTIWFRNGQKIADSTNSFAETPNNVKTIKNHSLVITNIKRSESGEYSCHVVTPGSNKSAKLSHLVNVLYPTSVFPEPSTGGLDVELMQGFILTCDVTGNPQPKIKWYFENREIAVKNEHVVVFNVTKATKEHAGEYRCVADNSVGKPVMASFQIRILYHPEIITQTSWIHSAIGERAELVCNVSANPRAKRGDTDGIWIQLIIPAANSFMSPIHSEMYTLTGLEPATAYEVVVSSKNEFGWSDVSKPFHFSTTSTNIEEVQQELDKQTETTSTPITTSSQITETTEEELQENALWSTDNATKLKVPLFLLILTIAMQ